MLAADLPIVASCGEHLRIQIVGDVVFNKDCARRRTVRHIQRHLSELQLHDARVPFCDRLP